MLLCFPWVMGPKKRPRTILGAGPKTWLFSSLHGHRTRANEHKKPEEYEADEHQTTDAVRRSVPRRRVRLGCGCRSWVLRGHVTPKSMSGGSGLVKRHLNIGLAMVRMLQRSRRRMHGARTGGPAGLVSR